ncbi:MAG: hypothetical protein ACREBU_05265 [Nitrososphaera sp.]
MSSTFGDGTLGKTAKPSAVAAALTPAVNQSWVGLPLFALGVAGDFLDMVAAQGLAEQNVNMGTFDMAIAIT